ncbi:preprotein translocase subunit SecG [Christiangramia salexigens]|uniref:Protein-export membrane protein SecG n=1 Tax=Christiangramia salexigens TaxID=1913577 RepID=A0A1L3J600_9FLAO|nr:preprotein translocase subunit SecG [Christiangramia salexigens]APG60555.1 preprotein translocase subunit SecG [Christiangramia salexigens]
MSTFTIFLALIIIVAFLLVVVIMVQNPKGGGLSSSFGGGGQQMGGVKKTTDFLDKSTWTLATLLLVLILLSNVTILDKPSGTETRVFESDEPVNTEIPSATPAQTETDSAQ